MTIQFNTDLVDRFVATGITTFDRAEIPDLRPAHDQHSYWLTNHFLESILTAYQVPFRQYAFNSLYRIQTAFSSYHEARDLTATYLSVTILDNPAIGAYFQALARWETCFLNWQILVEIFNKMSNGRVFEKDDKSPEQRAYSICNAIKHSGQAIGRGAYEIGSTIPMWLSNNGFHSLDSSLSYQELANVMLDAAQLADELQYPRQFAQTQFETL